MKIVVTGLGAHCALGENIKTLWDAIEQGHSGIVPINRFNVDGFDTQLGAMVSSGDCYDTEAQRLLAYGCAAATEALQHAKIVNRDRVALVLGTCNGLLGQEIHAVSSDLVHAVKLGGPAITLSTACASSAHAIGFAADMVRRGVAEFVLAGGVDILSAGGFRWLSQSRIASPNTRARPSARIWELPSVKGLRLCYLNLKARRKHGVPHR